MSRPSINKSVVLAAALVLSFGAAMEAGAQRRIPIRKDAPPPRDTVFVPAAMPDARRDTVWVVRQDTVNLSRVDTVVMIRDASRLRRGGAWVGLGGGASLPLQDFADLVDTGFEVQGTLGYQAPRSPWGVRLDLAYDKFLGQNEDTGGPTCPNGTAVPSGERCDDVSVYSAMLDGTLAFPIGSAMLPKWRPEFYVMGGVGIHHFSDQEDAGGAGDEGVEQSNTRIGGNAGAGISLGIGMADLFFETRYVYVKRDEVAGADRDSFGAPWMPLIVGFRFGAPFMRR